MSVHTTTAVSQQLQFDNVKPSGSPHKFFNWVDPSTAHQRKNFQEIEDQI